MEDTAPHTKVISEQLQDDLAAYVLGAVDAEEAERIEQVLLHSPEAQAELETLIESVSAMELSLSEGFMPSYELRERVLQQTSIAPLQPLSGVANSSVQLRDDKTILQRIVFRIRQWFNPQRAIYATGLASIVGLVALSITLLSVDAGSSSSANLQSSDSNNSPQAFFTAGFSNSQDEVANSAYEANFEPFLIAIPGGSTRDPNDTARLAVFSKDPVHGISHTGFRQPGNLQSGVSYKIWGITENGADLLHEFSVNPGEEGYIRGKISGQFKHIQENYTRIVITSTSMDDIADLPIP